MSESKPCMCGIGDKCRWPLLPGYVCKIGAFESVRGDLCQTKAELQRVTGERDRLRAELQAERGISYTLPEPKPEAPKCETCKGTGRAQ